MIRKDFKLFKWRLLKTGPIKQIFPNDGFVSVLSLCVAVH